MKQEVTVAWSIQQKVILLLLNCIPMFHLLALLLVAFLTSLNWSTRLLVILFILYLAPPLITRCILMTFPITKKRIKPGERDFFSWWATLNLQVIFCRFGFLEEILRCIPAAYSFWLRLWGAKIGRLTYWAAGMTILDRSFIDIGDDVVFGAGVRLNPHVFLKNAQGEMELVLDTISIGDKAMIGGYSLLTAGTQISPGECTRAVLVSSPFSEWKNGHRVVHDDTESK